ncbi:predicted protein [Histoplasma capsulatum H143]|uniref:Uncharacterized protein n=1 Tax=Ajellomyces capsulatus (strain H143) TaxID=544712 RepID=C6HFQ9_AJECH|nr:predicted protein [Histoplasma capsulatum H143]
MKRTSKKQEEKITVCTRLEPIIHQIYHQQRCSFDEQGFITQLIIVISHLHVYNLFIENKLVIALNSHSELVWVLSLGITFIIPDAQVSTAYSALLDAGFRRCTNKSSCCMVTTGLRGPPPTANLHLDDFRPLSLSRNSEILWTFPSFESTFLDTNDRDSLLASFFDPQLYLHSAS